MYYDHRKKYEKKKKRRSGNGNNNGHSAFFNRTVSVSAYINLAETARHEGSHKKALKVSQETVNKFPKNFRSHLQLGKSYFHLTRYKDALKATEQALNLNPNNTNIKTFIAKIERTIPVLKYSKVAGIKLGSNDYLNITAGLIKDDHRKLAIEAMYEAVDNFPYEHSLWCKLGKALYDENLSHKALEALHQVTELDPDNTWAISLSKKIKEDLQNTGPLPNYQTLKNG